MIDTTVYRTIANSTGTIKLWDLWDEREKDWYGEPCLEFGEVKEEGLWDNELYVKNFLLNISLRKYGKESFKKDLKDFCSKNGLDYKETKEELIAIYKTAKRLRFWRK